MVNKKLIFATAIVLIFCLEFASSAILTDFTETFTGTTINAPRWAPSQSGQISYFQNNKLYMNGTSNDTGDNQADFITVNTVNLLRDFNATVDVWMQNTSATVDVDTSIYASIIVDDGVTSVECQVGYINTTGTEWYFYLGNSSGDANIYPSLPLSLNPFSANLSMIWNTTSNNLTCIFGSYVISTIDAGIDAIVTPNLKLEGAASGVGNVLNVTFDNLVFDVKDYVKPSLISFVAPGIITSGTNRSLSNVPVNISAVDDYLIDSILIRLYNSARTLVNSTSSLINAVSGSYFINFTALSDGVYYVNATVNDTSNLVNDSSTLTVTVDTTAPVVTLISPADSTSSTTADYNFTFNVTDTNNVNNCSLIFDGSVINRLSSLIRNSTNGMYNSSLSVATHTWSINCTDSSSNIGNSSIRTLIVSSSSSSGGGLPSEGFYTVKSLSEEEFLKGVTWNLKSNYKISFEFVGENHHVGVKEIGEDYAKIEIASSSTTYLLDIGESAMKDLDDDGYYDIKVVLDEIDRGQAKLSINNVHEEVPEEPSYSPMTGEIIADDDKNVGGSSWFKWWYGILVLLVLVIIAIVVGLILRKK